MSGTIGFITLNNIDKAVEYYLPHIMMVLGFILNIFYNKINQCVNIINIKIPIENYIKFINVYLLTILIFNILNIGGTIIYISAAIFSLLILNYYYNNNYQKVFFVVIPVYILLSAILSQTSSIVAILIIVLIYAVVFYKTNYLFFSIAILIFSTKSFYIGPFIIVDAFHSSEYFLASKNALLGIFSVFPNIGYLEEVPALVLIKILKILSFDYINISIASSRSLIWIALEPIIFWYIYKRNKILSIIIILLLPVDRLSLLFAVIYSLIIINTYRAKRQKVFLTSLTLFPLIGLGFSPSYILIPALALIGIFPFKNIKRKFLILILIFWVVILAVFNSLFFDYITTYIDLSKNYDIAFSTSTSALTNKDLIFWPLMVLAVSIIAAGVINSNIISYINLIKYFFIILVLHQLISYGYGRVDPGFSRLLSLSIPLIFVANIISARYRLLSIGVLFSMLIFYSNLKLVKPIPMKPLELGNKIETQIELDASNAKIVNLINAFSNGMKVVNFSMEPALSPFILNVLIPPYTSPFVTLGERSQIKVINFIKSYPEAIIYIGHSFFTYDEVDVRLRAPKVFQYISRNYKYLELSGNIYAVPNSEKNSSDKLNLFFNDMDLKFSSLYYSNFSSNIFNSTQIFIDCNTNDLHRYKIFTTNNSIYGYFKCGKNVIPSDFLSGEIIEIKKL